MSALIIVIKYRSQYEIWESLRRDRRCLNVVGGQEKYDLVGLDLGLIPLVKIYGLHRSIRVDPSVPDLGVVLGIAAAKRLNKLTFDDRPASQY